MAVAPGEVSDQMIFHPGIVAGMSMAMSDSGVGGASGSKTADPVELGAIEVGSIAGDGAIDDGGAVGAIVVTVVVDVARSVVLLAAIDVVESPDAASDETSVRDAVSNEIARTDPIANVRTNEIVIARTTTTRCLGDEYEGGVTRSTVAMRAVRANANASNTPADQRVAVRARTPITVHRVQRARGRARMLSGR